MSKPRIQFQRLKKLADHLSRGKLAHDRFDFSVVNDNVPLIPLPGKLPGCGTAGCAMGECPLVFKRHWAFREPAFEGEDHVYPYLRNGSSEWLTQDITKFFGISPNAADHLFHPRSQNVDVYGGEELYGNATAKDVAKQIRAFIRRAKSKKFDDSVIVYQL
jgi:hypothetical protein